MFSSTKVKLTIKTLMKDIKAVISESLQFESRDKSNLIAVAGKFGLSVTWQMNENEWFLSPTVRYKCDCFTKDLVGEINPVDTKINCLDVKMYQ